MSKIFKYLLIISFFYLQGCGDSNFANTKKQSIEKNQGSEQTKDINKTKINKKPVAKDDNFITNQNESTLIDVLANDIDPNNNLLTIIAITKPNNGSVKIENRKIVYTPNKNFYGFDSFKYTIKNTKSETSSARVNINVKKQNSAPIANDDSVTTKENNLIIIDVLANDTDKENDLLRIKSISEPKNGKAKIENEKITYTPKSGFNGSDSFKYTIEDSNKAISTAKVYVKVIAKANSAPTAKDDNVTTNEDEPLEIDILSNDNDIDGDKLNIKSITMPKYASVIIKGTKVLYKPNKDYNGNDKFTYIVEDTNGATANATVFITIKAINDAPVAKANITPTNLLEGQEVTFDGSLSTDVDGDNLIYEWRDNDTLLSTNISFKKNNFTIGKHLIRLTVSDGKEFNSTVTVIKVESNTTQLSTLKKSAQTMVYTSNDDGDYQAGVDLNYNRDDSKDIVIDYVLNLEWQDNKEIKQIIKNWADAKEYCKSLSLGNYKDWRLPTRIELYSLIDFSKKSNVYDSTFINASADYYWTSTQYTSDSTKAWNIYFEDGRQFMESKDTELSVRCVREHH